MTEQDEQGSVYAVHVAFLNRQFQGEIVHITHRGNDELRDTIGVCRKFHHTAVGVDMELMNGVRYGFMPEFVHSTLVEGGIGPGLAGRRAVLIDSPGSCRGTNFRITAGPSREEIFDALRLHGEVRKVTFTIQGALRLEALVHAISIGDPSETDREWQIELYEAELTFGVKRLKCFYNTTRREGWLRPPGVK
jgi:hypothetical protein